MTVSAERATRKLRNWWVIVKAWCWLPAEKYALFRRGISVSHTRIVVLPLIPGMVPVTKWFRVTRRWHTTKSAE